MKFPKPQAMVSNDHPPILCAREVRNNKPTVLYKSLGSVRLTHGKTKPAENSALKSKEYIRF